jgi:hypothetical protein
MGVFSVFSGLIGKKKKKDSGEVPLIDPRALYRTDEQETAVFYFSAANKRVDFKGCFPNSEEGTKGCFKMPEGGIKGCFKKPKKVKTGCFPKREKGEKGCFKKPGKGCFPKSFPGKGRFVSDAEYDALVQSVVARLDPYQRGLQKLGLNESDVQEIKPLSFANFKYILFHDADSFFWKYGADGIFRSSVYEVTEIYFSGSQLFSYQLTLSMDWEKHDEQTREYHYKDITSLGTSTVQEDVIENGKKTYKIVENIFKITVPEDSFSVSLCNKPNEEEENSIQAMKAMIRAKKL